MPRNFKNSESPAGYLLRKSAEFEVKFPTSGKQKQVQHVNSVY